MRWCLRYNSPTYRNWSGLSLSAVHQEILGSSSGCYMKTCLHSLQIRLEPLLCLTGWLKTVSKSQAHLLAGISFEQKLQFLCGTTYCTPTFIYLRTSQKLSMRLMTACFIVRTPSRCQRPLYHMLPPSSTPSRPHRCYMVDPPRNSSQLGLYCVRSFSPAAL